MLFNRSLFVFNADQLEKLAQKHHESYLSAKPYPHIVLDDFLPRKQANLILQEFPSPRSSIWLDWKKRNPKRQPKKQGIGNASRLNKVSPYILNTLYAFNSYPFLNFLEKLTGIKALLSDPYFYGGGLHQILSGGKLSIHTDFNYLKQLNIYRQLNVLFYLNKNWKKEYNGELELWDKDLKKCQKSIVPSFNRVVIFNTNKNSFHGHPKPLNTPWYVTRKSLAFYYYTATPSSDEVYNTLTDWQDV